MKAEIVLVGHGDFAAGANSACELVYGASNYVTCLSLTADMSVEQLMGRLEKCVNGIPVSHPVIVCTDIQGGGTTQAAVRALAQKKNVHIVTGLTLGFVLEVLVGSFEIEPYGHASNAKRIDSAISLAKGGMGRLEIARQAEEWANADDGEL